MSCRVKSLGGARVSRRRFLQASGAAAVASLAGFPAIVRAAARARRVMVLGIDGMDPTLTARFLSEGRLPNAARLKERGCFLPLATSDPPQSPVAWSNFISGTNPGGHGIFDFIAREPASLKPYLSTARLEGDPWTLKVGRRRYPLGARHMVNLRKGPTLWSVLEQNGVDCRVVRMPANFPPTPSSGHTLSGLGTPDIHGSYGLFTYYTTQADARTRDVPGGRIEKVALTGGRVDAELRGPQNSFDADGGIVTIPFKVFVDPRSAAARVSVPGREFILRAGEWSDWIRVRFGLGALAPDVPAVCRFYLKSVLPYFELYVSPMNIDPIDPYLPISTPPSYARQLANENGIFYTQGMPQDTRARSQGVFDDCDYRGQAVYCLEEECRMFRHELGKFRDGFFFSYFGSLDMNSHMFWRTIDREHPLYTEALAREQGDFLPWLYGRMDQAIGEAMEAMDGQTTLIVVSDHGFTSFRRQFNLNAWLMDNGYAAALDPMGRGEQQFFGDVKWPATRAYGLGINALYLNVKGREPEGCVAPGEAQRALAGELAARLTAVKDPQTGEQVVLHAYQPREVYSGPYVDEAPDLLVCYNHNYRASWDTILGKYPREHFADNRDPWSGDHALDSQIMAGVFFCSHRVATERAALIDMAPTILGEFGVAAPREMTGRGVGSV